ncbi:uncharacterized protein [Primulina eburnea]|uniref:uncharacterized protein n=1 Tax=Primulina eburnea TaxID=1245227 RepID=UPI003C6C7326
MQSGEVTSLSPSFNSYSNTNLVEIAARVVEEFRAETDSDEFYFDREESFESMKRDGEYENKDEEFEFEFSTKGSESSPISADEIFYNGKIRPVYPVFDTHLLIGGDKIQNEVFQENGTKTIRLSLRKLFIKERETATTSSSSSSDVDELEGVPAETYCVWRPKAAATPLKSSSTGSSSKRWKLKDFLHRSHSEGSKDGVVLLTTGNSGRKKESEHKTKETAASAVKLKSAVTPPPATSLYNRDGGEKRRTYLPYRQDLVGFFSNSNGF